MRVRFRFAKLKRKVLVAVWTISLPAIAPGAVSDQYEGAVANVEVSASRGFYFAPVEITVSTPTAGARRAGSIPRARTGGAKTTAPGPHFSLRRGDTPGVRGRA